MLQEMKSWMGTRLLGIHLYITHTHAHLDSRWYSLPSLALHHSSGHQAGQCPSVVPASRPRSGCTAGRLWCLPVLHTLRVVAPQGYRGVHGTWALQSPQKPGLWWKGRQVQIL